MQLRTLPRPWTTGLGLDGFLATDTSRPATAYKKKAGPTLAGPASYLQSPPLLQQYGLLRLHQSQTPKLVLSITANHTSQPGARTPPFQVHQVGRPRCTDTAIINSRPCLVNSIYN